MKTYKNLYQQIYAFPNLHSAFRAARKGKRDRLAVASFEFNLEHNLFTLSDELRDQTYQPGSYNNFHIYEPKKRLISAAPFRDRVVHHALCNIIVPSFHAPRGMSFQDAPRRVHAERSGKRSHVERGNEAGE